MVDFLFSLSSASLSHPRTWFHAVGRTVAGGHEPGSLQFLKSNRISEVPASQEYVWSICISAVNQKFDSISGVSDLLVNLFVCLYFCIDRWITTYLIWSVWSITVVTCHFWWVSSTVCVHVYVCACMCMQHTYESLHHAHPPFWLYEVLIKMYLYII